MGDDFKRILPQGWRYGFKRRIPPKPTGEVIAAIPPSMRPGGSPPPGGGEPTGKPPSEVVEIRNFWAAFWLAFLFGGGGCVVTFLPTLLQTPAPNIAPWYVALIVFFGSCAVVGLIGIIVLLAGHFPPAPGPQLRPYLIIIGAVILVGGLLTAVVQVRYNLTSSSSHHAGHVQPEPLPTVYPAFQNDYADNRSEIGQPADRPVVPPQTNEYFYQRANAIWTDTYFLIAIVEDTNPMRWEQYRDRRYHSLTARPTVVAEFRKARLPTPPPGYTYPQGGLAKMVLNDPSWIKKIGWPKPEFCLFHEESDPIHVQRFEHGWIVGPLIDNNENLRNVLDRVNYLLLKNGQYIKGRAMHRDQKRCEIGIF
jgi:hypothetical protein